MDWKNIRRRAAIGGVVGIVVGVLIELAFSAHYGSAYVPGSSAFLAMFSNENAAVLVERCIYALLGVVQGAAGAILAVDRFSLAKATMLHMSVIVVSLIPAALYLRWIPGGWAIVGFVGITAGIYGVIWVVLWLCIRSQVRRLNGRLSGVQR